MGKYNTLVNILDQLRKEAPPEYKSYYPNEKEPERLNNARSKAFAHLFLKVKFGLLDFYQREENITEGPQDGGVDAYFIDEEHKKIYLIQSKFRENDANFERKELSISDLLKIDADRISKGIKEDSNGIEYNNKIQLLIDKIAEIRDIGRYIYQVIILANIKKLNDEVITKVISGFPYEIYDFGRCYKELVFPVVCGTFYNADQLIINLNLSEKHRSTSRVVYPVKFGEVECDVNLLFVPTLEIAKNFHKYKNSILQKNPRSYLDLARNPVNREIAKTIRGISTNEFSLFNNGLTFISDETGYSDKTGKSGHGQLVLINPQIINGGQTAYTLSMLYDETLRRGEDPEKMFGDKEVLVKIITFTGGDGIDQKKINNLINDISKATNSQNSIKESDRRANDNIQIEVQEKIYNQFGYYYERKRGEFYEGLRNHYISKEKVIDRQNFLRVCYTIAGFPAEAWRTGERQLFSKNIFDKAIAVTKNTDLCFFCYLTYEYLYDLRNKSNFSADNNLEYLKFGYALQEGILALVYVLSRKFGGTITVNTNFAEVKNDIDSILSTWSKFEESIVSKPANKEFFIRRKDENTGDEYIDRDFKKYYRGNTLRGDLDIFFGIANKEE